MSPGEARTASAKDLLQELRSNRRTQVMALVALVVVGWSVWVMLPEPRKARPRAGAAGPAAASVLGDVQLKQLEKLPDLARAAGAGELPPGPEMARDLFLFDAPARRVERVQIEVPPPPPPSEAELKAEADRRAREQESATRPSGVRFIGVVTTRRKGPMGAFMKAEEALTLPLGDLFFKGWKLVKVDETGAEFQNLRFPDMRHKLQPTEGGGPGGQTAVRNEF